MKKEDTLFKYVKKIGIAYFDNEEKNFYDRKLICDNGSLYQINRKINKVGQSVFIAKPVQVLKHQPKKFVIHEVILPANVLYFNMLKNAKTPKERRLIIKEAYQDIYAGHFPILGNYGTKSFLIENI